MKRLFTFASLTLLALASSAFAGKSNPHKPENQANKPKPIIRDHRTSSGNSQGKPQSGFNSLSNQSGGVNVSSNGSIGRRPATADSKPLNTMTGHQMSPLVPPRDPRPLTSHPMSPQTPPRDPRPLSSQLLVSPGAKDQRFTPVTGSSPVVRDHRDQSGYGGYPYYGKPDVSNMSGGVMVTQTNDRGRNPKIIDSPVAVAPQLSPRGPAPVVRDHRVLSSTAANYNWPSINQTTSPVVRDHRSNGSTSGDNTIYGTGPGLHTVVDAVGSGLTSVGNVFGIGYGSVTSGAPTRPQVVDHRNH